MLAGCGMVVGMGRTQRIERHGEGADAFRQWAQAKENGQITLGNAKPSFKMPPPPDWRT
jgi:hypothetical protein